MAAHRYWRIASCTAHGEGDLELGELNLYDASGRIDDLAVLSSTVPPSIGSLESLRDGVTSAVVGWKASLLQAANFAITWDFGGAPKSVQAFRVGPGREKTFSLSLFDVEYSDDGALWNRVGPYPIGPLQYPAGNATVEVFLVAAYSFAAILLCDGDNGGSAFVDSSRNKLAVTPVGQVTTDTTRKLTGLSSAKFVATGASVGGGSLLIADSPLLDLSSVSYTIEMYIWLDAAAITTNVVLFNKQRLTDSPYQIQLRALRYGPADFRLAAYWDYGSSIESVTSMPLNRFVHVAVCRSGSTLRGFVDGQLAFETLSFPAQTVASNTFPASIGAYSDGRYGMSGWLDGFWLTIGSAKYSGEFVPPAHLGDPYAGTGGAKVNLTDYAKFASSPVSAALATHTPVVDTLARDIEFSGRGRIAGTVKVKGTPNVPTKRRVRLLRDRDFLLVRETWSDPVTGAYAFHEIDERHTYTVIADDYEGNFRAVLADRVVPEVMQ